MKFPDPNIGYVCGYNSKVVDEGILVTFLGGTVKILFEFDNIKNICKEKYQGGRISWDVIRWGRCPKGTEAMMISLKKGAFKDHIIVFKDLEVRINDLKSRSIHVKNS